MLLLCSGIASVPLISAAGEIIPQAACKSYGLAIGAYAAPFVRLLIWVVYIIAKPISMVLDWALGEDHGASCHACCLIEQKKCSH